MLVLSRKVNERIHVGDSIVVTVVRLEGGKVRLGIEAPRDVLVSREELTRRGHPRTGVTDRSGREAAVRSLPAHARSA